jgi:methyl-accepting chemotaxis protein
MIGDKMLNTISKVFKINTINKKFNISIITFYITIMILSTIIFINIETNKQNSEIKSKGETYATLAAYASSDPIWNFDENGLKSIIDSFFNDKEIYSITVLDKNENILYTKTTEKIDLKNSGILKFTSNIERDNNSLGKVELTMNKYYLNKNLQNNLTQSIIQSSIIVILLSGIIFVVSRRITGPLNSLIKASNKISKGNYEVRSNIKTNDEVGLLSKRFDNMAENIQNAMSELNTKSNDLELYITNLKDNNKSMLNTSVELNNSSTDLAALSEELNAGMQEISSNSNIISQVITNVFEKTTNATSESDLIVLLSSESVKIVKTTIEKINIIKNSFDEIQNKVKSLEKQSEQISKLTSLISDISSQTNLIALNASIEAARAGESGKGFTVVANEIRNLSVATNTAVVDINNLIIQIKDNINETVVSTKKGNLDVIEGVTLTKETSISLNKIFESIGKNKELIKEIEKESNKAVEGAKNVASSTDDFLLAIEQLVSSSNSLSKVSEKLLLKSKTNQ